MLKLALFIISFFCASLLLLSQIEAKEVKLGWKKIENVARYHLQVSATESFEQWLVDKETSKNSLKAELPSGVYFLRVAGMFPNGKTGDWSQPFRLVVTAPINENDKLEKMPISDDPISLISKWKVEDRATSYKVMVEKDGNEIISTETTTPEYSFSVNSPGQYEVKVSSGLDEHFGPSQVVRSVLVQYVKPAKKSDTRTQLPFNPIKGETPRVKEIGNIHHNWLVGLGVVISNSMTGANGSKYNIHMAKVESYSERVDYKIFYDGNFDTATQGSTPFTEIGIGSTIYYGDRLTTNSPSISADLGYGGNNRNYDAGPLVGAGLGWEFFKATSAALQIEFHFALLANSGGGTTSYPSWQSLRFLILF